MPETTLAPSHLAVLRERFEPRLDDLGLSIDRIRTAIRAHDVNRQLPPTAKDRLLPSQLRAFAVVPFPADRARMASQAVAESWTAAQTEEQVAAYRLEAGVKGKGGRPPLPVPLKAAYAATRNLAKLGEIGAVATLAPEAKDELREELARVKATVEAWLARL
ncbi:MAG: hypothetical protein ACOYOB_20575 [Myxococcota bacterium]